MGEGLARQSDGKLVLAGSIDVAVPPATLLQFAVMRLNNDGTPDDSFGSRRQSQHADHAPSRRAAKAVALDADGKIVVAGRSNNRDEFELRRRPLRRDGDARPRLSTLTAG